MMTDWEFEVLYEFFEEVYGSIDNVPEEILSVVNRTHEGFDIGRTKTYSEDYDYDAYEYMIVDRSI